MNGQDFRWTIKKSKFLRRKGGLGKLRTPPSQTKNDAASDIFHSMVESNSLENDDISTKDKRDRQPNR